MLDQRIRLRDEFDLQGFNRTEHYIEDKMKNITLFKNLKLPEIDLNPSQWLVILEQMLLFILILGRWMLPKGKISRDELSQLLLVYLGMAADIIEFFEAFKEEKVKYNRSLIVTILSIWSASLFQFTLVLTATKSPKMRAGFQGTKRQLSDCCTSCLCCDTEVFGIMTTMLLQDGPFLILRLVLLLRYHVVSYMHIFFTVKNTMVLLLIFYRLFVLFEARMDKKTGEKEKEEYVSLDGDLEPSKPVQNIIINEASVYSEVDGDSHAPNANVNEVNAYQNIDGPTRNEESTVGETPD